MSADSAVENAASGKATSDHPDRDKGKDIPRPKPKRPVDPTVVVAAAGKLTPSPHKSISVPKPRHELPMPHGPSPPRAAFTVPEFCEAHRISVAKYYEMKKEGWGPVEMGVGRRRLISYEAASVWRREREVETATSSTAGE
jgi:hypothetical protein